MTAITPERKAELEAAKAAHLRWADGKTHRVTLHAVVSSAEGGWQRAAELADGLNWAFWRAGIRELYLIWADSADGRIIRVWIAARSWP